MKISIICVGKIQKKYFNDFIDDYLKRLSKYCKVEIIEINDVVLKDDSDKGILKVQSDEGNLILSKLDKQAFKVCLVIEGKDFNSEGFAKLIEDISITKSHIQFIIGGSYGLSNEVKNSCDLKMSFSKLTFPHQMFRGMLVEQLYRCFKIIKNEKYHK